jgi:glycosyltransferase involved in cell wall biosynthesis
MKIAYLSTFYPFRGGIAQFNATLYRLFEKDHEIKAFTFTRQYPDLLFPGKTQFVQQGDNTDPIPAEKTLDSINPLSYITTGKKLKKYAPDLLLTKFWMPFFAPSLGWSAKMIKKQTVNIAILDNVIPHERRPGDMALIRFFLNQYHGFIVMSKAVENDLLSLKPKAYFKYCPHPIYSHFGEKVPRSEALSKLDLPKDKKIILFFGFIRDYKGLDILIEAMKYLPDDHLSVIAGESYGDFKKYSDLIEKHGVNNKIKLYVRYINDNEVPLFFSAADVCVQPYKSATQSGIAGIAFHFGVPLIATDVGGLKEIIEPFGTGIMVEKPEAKLIADSIILYFNNDSKDKMEKNIDRFRTISSWENFGSNIIELYNEIKQSKK